MDEQAEANEARFQILEQAINENQKYYTSEMTALKQSVQKMAGSTDDAAPPRPIKGKKKETGRNTALSVSEGPYMR